MSDYGGGTLSDTEPLFSDRERSGNARILQYVVGGLLACYTLAAVIVLVIFGIHYPVHFLMAALLLLLQVLLVVLYRWWQSDDVENKFIWIVVGCAVILLVGNTTGIIYAAAPPACHCGAGSNSDSHMGSFNGTNSGSASSPGSAASGMGSGSGSGSGACPNVDPCPDQLYWQNAPNSYPTKCFKVCDGKTLLNLTTNTCVADDIPKAADFMPNVKVVSSNAEIEQDAVVVRSTRQKDVRPHKNK